MGEVKERPIIFNGEMVRAILDGRKTQTRRPLKRNLPEDAHYFHFIDDEEWARKRGIDNTWSFFVHDGTEDSWPCNDEQKLTCPFGKPGDRLWVRETVADVNSEMGPTLLYKADEQMIGWEDFSQSFGEDYGAGPSMDYDTYPGIRNEWSVWWSDIDLKGEGGRWSPSIHMPRWASRITLEITNIRVERVQNISEEDAMAEGVAKSFYKNSYRNGFLELWDSIYKNYSENPWVWVVEFKRITP